MLAEARELAADGAVELNLIGQDTTSYGTDIGYAAGLSGLLRTLDREMKDVHWLRLMYAYPSCFTDEMIDTIAASGRVVKYIDMPLQHINDDVLAKMKRRVTRRQIETLLEKLRNCVPGIALRTTFIAGSPGETDAQHDELVKFVKEFGFDMMGVFPYSREPGTPMGRMDGQVPDDVKQASGRGTDAGPAGSRLRQVREEGRRDDRGADRPPRRPRRGRRLRRPVAGAGAGHRLRHARPRVAACTRDNS